MRILKFIFSFVFITALFVSKGHNSFIAVHQGKWVKVTLEASNNVKTIHGDEDDQDDLAKRKRRIRGIEVTVPQIPDLTFEQSYSYREAIFPKVNVIYCSFQQYIPGKRGPPLA